jgi:radical SAM-linked protein
MTTGDYLDVELTGDLETDYIREELNAVMNDEIGVIRVSKLEDFAKTSMAVLAAADYTVCIKPEKSEHFGNDFFEKLQDNIKGYLAQEEILVTKKTKKSERVMDIKDNIYYMESNKKSFEEKTGLTYTDESFDYDYYKPIFFIRLTHGSVLNIKPETVIESFCTYAGVKFDSLFFQLNRLEMFADKNGEKGKVNTMNSEVKCELVSLDRWQAI